MTTNNLVLVGGGGHCLSVIDAVESAGWNILGILDKDELRGRKILKYQVIGDDSDIPSYIGKALFVITVGQVRSPETRIKLHRLVTTAGGELATIIASTAYVSKYAKIGNGTVILHNAFVNSGATIGDGCIINTFADIEHNVKIGNFCHISTGALVNGDCIVGEQTFLGSNSVVSNGITICSNSIIGAGSVVLHNISAKGIYAGNPAQKIK